MDILTKFAAEISDLRLTGLFGSESSDLPDFADTMNEEATQHYLMALSFLEQAHRSIKLAAIANKREVS
jgi:hypothetical protein